MPKKKLSKREKRLQRQVEKQAEQVDKNARLAESVVIKQRGIRSKEIPLLVRQPRGGDFDISEYLGYCLTWSYDEVDLEGEWSWGEIRQWDDDEYIRIIEPHFQSQKNSTWNDIVQAEYNGRGGARRKLNKEQSLGSLVPEAQSRWMSFSKLEEFDTVFRFRLGSSRRVWGVRISHHFFVVWYERGHCIYPINGQECKKGSF